MPRGVPITLRDLERAADHYALWGSWSAAAAHIGVSYGGLMGALRDFPEERVDWENRFKDRLRVETVERAFDKTDKSSSWFLQHLRTEHLPEARDVLVRRQFELTGAGGKPLEVRVEHDYSGLIAGLEQVGLIRRSSEVADAEVSGSAGRELLPTRSD